MQPEAARGAFFFTALAEDLARYGWLVEALPAQTTGSGAGQGLAKRESRGLVRYRRISLRRARETTRGGRFLINARMILAWAGLALRPAFRRPDIVLIGPEPAYGLLAAWLIKRLCPDIQVAHWRLSSEEDAACARTDLEEKSVRARLRRALMRRAYEACDLIAETDPRRIVGVEVDEGKAAGPRQVMILPWLPDATEPPDGASPVLTALLRQALFGAARIGVLCLLRAGEGDDHRLFFELARTLASHPDISFCLAYDLEAAAEAEALADAAGAGVRLVLFTDLHAPLNYLSACDIHFITSPPGPAREAMPLDAPLLESLAAGRPVLLAGPADSETAQWIARTRVGWVVTDENLEAVALMLGGFAQAQEDLAATSERCWQTYAGRIRRIDATAQWHEALSALAGEAWFNRPAFTEVTPYMNLSHPHFSPAGRQIR